MINSGYFFGVNLVFGYDGKIQFGLFRMGFWIIMK